MDEKILKWLYDIQIAIQEINGYFENSDKDFFQYRKNIMLKRAIERNLEIIGEAVNRIIKEDSSFQTKITNTKAIIGLRNHIIHAYDNVSDENIWSILIHHLPLLKSDVDQLIEQNNL